MTLSMDSSAYLKDAARGEERKRRAGGFWSPGTVRLQVLEVEPAILQLTRFVLEFAGDAREGRETLHFSEKFAFCRAAMASFPRDE